MKLTVKECENQKGKYFTIINPKTNSHCHALDRKTVNKVENCFNTILKGKSAQSYGFSARNKTMKLFVKG